MSGNSLVCLDTTGYVTDPLIKADRLLAYFFVSDYSQSNSHLGYIHSLPYIIQSNISNLLQMGIDIEESLKILFRNYFDSMDVTVKVEPVIENGIESETKRNILLDIIVIEDGVQYSLGKAVSLSNSKVKKVINRTT